MSNPIIRLFPLLYNIKNFVQRDHPSYHPETQDYVDYWEEQEKRCVEGLWGLDSNGKEGGWRYCPGPLYYYVNFCVIEDEDEDTNSSKVINPLLRDIEWIFFLNWLICRGFSGFINDTEYTCNYLIKKLENGEVLTSKDNLRLQTAKHLYKPDGSYKKYVDPREYLYRTHDKPLGYPLYENTAKNLFVLTARGTGKSYFMGALISHTFKFHGAVYYNQNYFNLDKGPEIVVGSALSGKSAELLKKFSFIEEFQKNNYGAWGENDEFMPGWFFLNTSGTLTVSNMKSPYRNEYEYVEAGIWKKGGKGTKIVHVSYESNSEAAVGHRPILHVIEEVGLMQNLLQTHSSNETTMIRRNKFGSAIYAGTGGDMDKIIESKIVFEDPESYDMLPFPDLWENRKKPIGLFLPAYYTDNSFRDENGNQNIELAYEEEMHQRKIRAAADNSFALDGYMMARPLLPSEIFLSSTANTFPTAILRDRLTEVEVKKIFELVSFKGELEWKNNDKKEVKFVPDYMNKLKPIIQTNLDQYKGNLKGCIIFYESPEEEIPDPTRRSSLYKVVYDPLKDDGKGTSLASILVYKGISDDWATGLFDDIVCEYIGRTDLVEDIHDIALKIATYYNAKIMVETNIPDFIRYCRRENKLHMLAGKPTDAISKAIKNPGKKYDVGIDMSSPALHEHAEQLIRQWLLTKWKIDKNDQQLLNAHKLKSPRLLLELIQYDRDKNFDHVSSFKLLHLWLSQDKQKPVEKASKVAKDSLDNFYDQLKKTKLHKNPYHNY
jgi:hypothetical protein